MNDREPTKEELELIELGCGMYIYSMYNEELCPPVTAQESEIDPNQLNDNTYQGYLGDGVSAD